MKLLIFGEVDVFNGEGILGNSALESRCSKDAPGVADQFIGIYHSC